MRRSEKLLRVLLDSLTDGLALLSAEGVIEAANPALAALCEVEIEALLGRGWLEPGLPGGELVTRTLADGSPQAGRLQVQSPTGRGRTLDAQVVAVAEGEERRLLVRLSDVTERLQLEHVAIENERLAASGRLATAVAHEVNTPLQAIQTLLYEAAQEDLAPGERAATLALASDEIRRVSEILRRLLSLHQLDDAAVELVDCNQVLERVLLLMTRSLERQGVQVVRELAPALPPVRGRLDQLTQVVLNIVLNAIDAMPDGGTLTLGSALGAGSTGRDVVLTVRDTGQGIAADDAARIFDPFFTTKAGGTGLGLAVSRHIVSAHGGTLSVRSAPGAGATFTIRLPAVPGETAA